MSAETVLSLLTPTGRGAVAVIAVRGPHAAMKIAPYFHAKNRKPLAEQPLARIVYGRWHADGEDLIVCPRAEDEFEIHCHGGSQAVSSIMEDLKAVGCKEISWQEWVDRSDTCSMRSEARKSLAQAASSRAALVLLDQFHGSLSHEVSITQSLASTNLVATKERIARLLATTEFGLHLTRPWRVVIAGLPNVGKSSLINALVGYRRAIVFDQPGTTRDVVSVETVVDGWPVSLSDTAGLHRPSDQLEAAGIELAKQWLASADLMIWVLDAAELTADVQTEMHRQVDALNLQVPDKLLLVLNKIDRVPEGLEAEGAIRTSATSGLGIEELLMAISRALVPKVPSAGEPVVFTERQQTGLTSALKACRRGDVAGVLRELHLLAAQPVCGT